MLCDIVKDDNLFSKRITIKEDKEGEDTACYNKVVELPLDVWRYIIRLGLVLS